MGTPGVQIFGFLIFSSGKKAPDSVRPPDVTGGTERLPAGTEPLLASRVPARASPLKFEKQPAGGRSCRSAGKMKIQEILRGCFRRPVKRKFQQAERRGRSPHPWGRSGSLLQPAAVQLRFSAPAFPSSSKPASSQFSAGPRRVKLRSRSTARVSRAHWVSISLKEA